MYASLFLLFACFNALRIDYVPFDSEFGGYRRNSSVETSNPGSSGDVRRM